MMPNHSFNRKQWGMPPFGAQTPSYPTAPVNSDVRPLGIESLSLLVFKAPKNQKRGFSTSRHVLKWKISVNFLELKMAISIKLIALMSVSAIGLISVSAAAHSENQAESRKSGPKNSGGNTKEKARFNDSDSGKRAKTQVPTGASGSPGTLPPESTRFQVDQKLDMPDFYTVKARTKADSNGRRRNQATARPSEPAQ